MASVDPAFGVDSFNRPKVLSETETIVNNILFILFGKPGSYPSIPSLGMDIEQYLYLFEQSVSDDCCDCNKGKGQTQKDYESWSSGVYPNDEGYDRTNYARTGSAWNLTTEPGKCECNRHE